MKLTEFKPSKYVTEYIVNTQAEQQDPKSSSMPIELASSIFQDAFGDVSDIIGEGIESMLKSMSLDQGLIGSNKTLILDSTHKFTPKIQDKIAKRFKLEKKDNTYTEFMDKLASEVYDWAAKDSWNLLECKTDGNVVLKSYTPQKLDLPPLG